MQKPVSIHRSLPIGAEVSDAGVHFRVWAPKRKRVAVVYKDRETAMIPEEKGYFSVLDPRAKAGDLYRFRFDEDRDLYPDMTSRFQPEGVLGPSQIVDPRTFEWTDHDFPGVPANGQVLYEMHIGTFTPEGTWRTAMAKLPFLRDLGITCLEIMPINEFPGRFNWGYDGADQFAPSHNYGTPDDLRRFINEAHRLGIGVILDVVYNHFGPSGNFLGQFSDDYFTDKYKNDWGKAINFDGEKSAPVREFFIANATYWITEFHFDGYRYDATQALVDGSPEHIITALGKAARAAAPHKSIYLIAENEPQETWIVRPSEQNGFGLDALWNDDFHHTAMVNITGRNEAYYTDHAGQPQEYISALKYGYLFQGQIYRWQNKRRGTPGLDLPAHAFVHFLQNHDQIANFGPGRRMHDLTSPAMLRAITALWLLSPQTPMFFQGQEFAASSPFYYFGDHHDELNGLIRQGRLREIQQFPSFQDARLHPHIPVPGNLQTFEDSKLRWEELDLPVHARVLALHRDLLKLRHSLPFFQRITARCDIDGAVLDKQVFCLRYFGENQDDLLIIVNLANDVILHSVPEPLLAPPAGKVWETLWSSEDPAYGGLGVMPLESAGERWRLAGENWRIPAMSTTLLHPGSPPEDDPELTC